MSNCTSIAGHFDGHADVLKQWTQYHPMQQIQGCTGCPWKLAATAARVTGKQTTMTQYTYVAGHYDRYGNAPVRYHAHCPMNEVQGFTGSHWTLPPCELFQKYRRKPWGSDRCYLVSHPCMHQSRRRKKDFTSGGLKGTSREAFVLGLWLLLLVRQECVCMCVLKLVRLSRTEKSRSRRVQQ